MIKAIPTQYSGYNFKSRIEARWAVFFDTLGIKWEYEKEGYVLSDGTWYLPDFWLPELYLRRKDKKGIWIEVKGAYPDEAAQKKCELFAEGIQQSIILVWGAVEAGRCYTMTGDDGYYEYSPDGWDSNMCFFTCNNCDTTKVEFAEGNYEYCPCCGEYAGPEHPLLLEAMNRARNAKF